MAESSREEIAKLEALYANNPEGRVFTHLAEAYRKAGELDRARTILDDGLAKHPAYASAHVVLGRVLTDQQRPDDAAEEFRRVLELDPHNHVALRCLGDIARSSGRREEALQYFQDLRHLDPNNEEVSAIIDELSAAPDVASMQEAQPEPQPEPGEPEPFEPEHFEPPQFEPDAVPQEPLIAASEFEPPALEDVSEDLGQDLEFDWMPSAEEEPESGLPGDLAELAGMSTPAEPAIEPSGFETPSEAGSLGDMALSMGEPAAEPPPEPEPQPFVVEGFGETPVAEPAGAQPEEAGEVLTETIAELYRAQGLHDRAADVYRALIAQRPDEQALKDKLAEVEALANAPAPRAPAEPEMPAEAPATPEPEAWSAEPWASAPASEPEPMGTTAPPFEPTAQEAPEPEPEAAGAAEPATAEAAEPAAATGRSRGVEAEAWIAGASGTAESAPTPYAWAEQAPSAEEVSGPPITSYFQRLLSWRPRTVPQAAPVVEEPVAPVEEPEMPVSEQRPPEPPPSEAPLSMQAEPEPEPEPMLVLDEQVVETREVVAAPEQPEPARPEPAAESFDAWLQQEPAPAPSTSGDAGDVFDEWFGASEPEPAPDQSEAAPGGEAEQGGPEDDDDLEMFRSWLQSLKK